MYLIASLIPDRSLKGIGSLFSALEISLEIAGSKVWFIRVDFPEPDTPVTQTNKSKGNSKLMFFKLCPLAFVSFIGFRN